MTNSTYSCKWKPKEDTSIGPKMRVRCIDVDGAVFPLLENSISRCTQQSTVAIAGLVLRVDSQMCCRR